MVEAFNLRAAIEHTRKNNEMAVEALSDMPPRREQELDPVTLHNQARVYEDILFTMFWDMVWYRSFSSYGYLAIVRPSHK